MNGHTVILTLVDYHKDLHGSYFNFNLNFHQYISKVALNANLVLACVKSALIDLNNDVFKFL